MSVKNRFPPESLYPFWADYSFCISFIELIFKKMTGYRYIRSKRHLLLL